MPSGGNDTGGRAATDDVRTFADRLAAELAGCHDAAAIAGRALLVLQDALGAHAASIARMVDGVVEPIAWLGMSNDAIGRVRGTDLRTSAWAQAVLRGEPVFVGDRNAVERLAPHAAVLSLFDSHAWALLPLRLGPNDGVLALHFRAVQAFDGPQRSMLLEAAAVIETMITNSRSAE